MALEFQLSGGIGNTSSDASTGGARSGTNIVDATSQNLIDDVSRKEVLVGKTEYRCFYVYNSSTTLDIHGGILYIDQDPSATTITMGLDPAGTGDGQTTGVAQTIVTEDTSPTSVVFEDAGQYRVKLALPRLRPQESQAIWIKRVATAGSGGVITIGVTGSGEEETVIPADLTINDISVANPTFITFTTNHNLDTNNVITISGSDSTPSVDGVYVVTYQDDDTISIPVNVTVAGTTGTAAIGGDTMTGDGFSIGERTSVVGLAPPFYIGTARIGFSEMG